MAKARVHMTRGIGLPPCLWVSPKARAPQRLSTLLRAPEIPPLTPRLLPELSKHPHLHPPPRTFRLAEQPSPCLQEKNCTQGWLQTSWAGTSPSSEAWASVRVFEQNHMTPAGSMVKSWWGFGKGALGPHRVGAKEGP